ncbi:MAG TPA: hypothetical protein VNV86_20655 [Candidatus Acidoferrum sp.]|nr:hypothetical protein [Candidatus Acidoferrum sp.]
MTWRLEAQTLAAPGKPRPIVIKTRGNCPSSDAIAVRRKRGGAILAVNGDALARQAPGWLADWARRAEESGCASPALTESVLDATPLKLPVRYHLLHPNHARSGYIDLGEGSRLQAIASTAPPADALRTIGVVATPGGLEVTVEGAPPAATVKTTWYAVRESGIEPLGDRADANPFAGVHGRYRRLVYKADQTSVIVGANSRRELEADTAALLAGTGPCANCVAVPRSMGVNPYQAVMVNGREVRVALGATLERVIAAAGKKPAEVMPTLAISKRFAGKMIPIEFARTKPDVLGLVMEGDEEIRW